MSQRARVFTLVLSALLTLSSSLAQATKVGSVPPASKLPSQYATVKDIVRTSSTLKTAQDQISRMLGRRTMRVAAFAYGAHGVASAAFLGPYAIPLLAFDTLAVTAAGSALRDIDRQSLAIAALGISKNISKFSLSTTEKAQVMALGKLGAKVVQENLDRISGTLIPLVAKPVSQRSSDETKAIKRLVTEQKFYQNVTQLF